MSQIFYPQVSSIVSIDSLPADLNFIKNGLTALFGNLYFTNLQYSKNQRGDSFFYTLTLVSQQEIEIDLFGSGITLVIDPSFVPGNPTMIPLQVNFQWKILAFLKDFNPATFSFNGQDIFNLLLQITGISEYALVNKVLTAFLSSSVNPINQFVDNINTAYSTSIP